MKLDVGISYTRCEAKASFKYSASKTQIPLLCHFKKIGPHRQVTKA